MGEERRHEQGDTKELSHHCVTAGERLPSPYGLAHAFSGCAAIREHPRSDQIVTVREAMLRHHIAGGQGPALSSLGFVLLRAENLIVQQHVISLKQIWKMLPKD